MVIDRGEIRKRRKAPSKQFREDFGHTPLSIEEDIPWKCARPVIGTGACSSLPVMNGVKQADVLSALGHGTLCEHGLHALLDHFRRKTRLVVTRKLFWGCTAPTESKNAVRR